MTNVVPLFQSFEDIYVPAPLRDMPNWLIWRFEKYKNEPKPRKVPYWTDGTIRHGQQGSPTDRTRLTTFAAARDAAARKDYDGVGFAHIEGCGIVTLDFDKCVGPDGKVRQDVLDLVTTTYAEYSPSGKGIHAIFVGDAGILGNQRATVTEGPDFSVEAFSSSGFTTFTGNTLDYVDIVCGADHLAPLPDITIAACQKRFGSRRAKLDPDDFMAGHEPRLGLTIGRIEELLAALDPDMGREQWIKTGMAVAHETDGGDDGFEIWDDWSSDGHSYPGTEALRVQWDSFERRKGSNRKQVTMASVIWMAKQAGYRGTGIDISDLRQQAQEVTSNLLQVDGVRTPDDYRGKFPVYAAGDPALHKSTEWHIKGVLPKADLIVLYGASGSGKSFVAFDMIAAVARGTQWQGCRVNKAKVVLIAAEGAGGVGKRIRAYCKHYGLKEADLDIGIIRVPPNVMENVDVQELANTLTAVGADVFVIDTLAQVTPGANENSGEDMGQAIRNIRLITDATGATALVVHHAGKDTSRGARGWSGIRAAADAEIEISRNDTGHLISVTKMKDGDDSQQWGFRLDRVEVGIDDDGDIETSCVVEYVEAPPKRVKSNEPKGKVQATIMERARHCGAGTPEGALMQDVIDASVGMIPFDPVQAEGEKKPRDQRRGSVTRAVTSLCNQGHLVTRDDRLYEKGFEPHYTSEHTVSLLDASASNCFKSEFADS
jgi:hypothetical protein